MYIFQCVPLKEENPFFSLQAYWTVLFREALKIDKGTQRHLRHLKGLGSTTHYKQFLQLETLGQGRDIH